MMVAKPAGRGGSGRRASAGAARSGVADARGRRGGGRPRGSSRDKPGAWPPGPEVEPLGDGLPDAPCQARGQLLRRDRLAKGEDVLLEMVAVAERIVHRRLEAGGQDTERSPCSVMLLYAYCGATTSIALRQSVPRHVPPDLIT
jgi:hypothetical protein